MRQLVIGKQVYLIKYKERAHAIRLAGSQETIDESGGGDRMIDRDNQCRLVDISCKYMTLLAEISGATDDIIAALFYLANPVRTILLSFNLYAVAYRNRIGTTDTTDAEIAFYTAFHIRTIVQSDDVRATRWFNY